MSCRESVAGERRIEANIGTSICSLVAAGLGLAVIDPFTAAHCRDPRVARRPFRPRIPYQCALVTPSYKARSNIVEEFVATLRRRISNDFLGPSVVAPLPTADSRDVERMSTAVGTPTGTRHDTRRVGG